MNDVPHEVSARSPLSQAPTDPPDARASDASGTKGRKRWPIFVVGLLILLPLFYFLHKPASGTGADKSPTGAGGDASKAGEKDRVIPVAVAPATARDVPVYLEGLGSVLPIQSVTLHSQVEGKLERVFFTEGQAVKRGQLIAQIDTRPFMAQLHQVQATLARDNAQVRNAQVNLDRYKSLREQNLVPQQQVDDQQAMVAQLSASVQQDQAQVESSQLQLDYAHLTSPIDGVTGVRQVDPGNVVHVNDPLGIVLITQLDPIAVVFTLPEDDLPDVSKQLAAGPLVVEAYARDGTTKLGAGKLALIDNQIDATTATIKLKAWFDNHDHALWPNQFVKARLLLTTLKGALTVPAPAIQRGPQGVFVYVVSAQNTVSMKPVEIARTEGDTTILTSGLAVGDSVVIDGQNQLRPGSKVSTRSAADHAAGEHAGGGGHTAASGGGHAQHAGSKP